jgi:hypothetical protein
MRKVIVRVSPEVVSKISKKGNTYRVQPCLAQMYEDGELVLGGRINLFVRERDGIVQPHPAGTWQLPEGYYLAADNGGVQIRAPEFPPVSQLVAVEGKSKAAA